MEKPKYSDKRVTIDQLHALKLHEYIDIRRGQWVYTTATRVPGGLIYRTRTAIPGTGASASVSESSTFVPLGGFDHPLGKQDEGAF